MVKVRQHWQLWLAAPATSTRSLRSLEAQRPTAVGTPWTVSDPVAYRQAVQTGHFHPGPAVQRLDHADGYRR
jgi:hypothetical protein